LGDALDSPLLAWERDGIDEPEYFGRGRNGGYLIRKSHYTKDHKEITVFTQRDPRDVVISRMYYRQNRDITGTIKTLEPHYKPSLYWWLENEKIVTRYEWLHKRKEAEIKRLVYVLTGKSLSVDRCKQVWEKQSIATIKKRYGKRFAGSVRKGIVGDWKNHFTKDHCKLITEIVGEFMLEQGYIDSLDWWKDYEGKRSK
jgi:hypothetical protein